MIQVPQENATVQTEIRATALAHRFSATCRIWDRPVMMILPSWVTSAGIIPVNLTKGTFLAVKYAL